MIHVKVWFVTNIIDAKGSCLSKLINEDAVFVSSKIIASFVTTCNCNGVFIWFSLTPLVHISG